MAKPDPVSETKRAIGVWLLSVMLIATDLFGIGDAAKLISQSWFYDVASPVVAGGREANIVVVLATDDDLEELQTFWPMPYEIQSEVLAELDAHQPTGIFLDIQFLDRRDADQDALLIDTLTSVQSPVVMAAPETSDLDAFYRQLTLEGVLLANANVLDVEGDVAVLPPSSAGKRENPPVGTTMRDLWCATNVCAEFGLGRAEPTELTSRPLPYACSANALPSDCGSWNAITFGRFASRIGETVFPQRKARTLSEQGLFPFPTITISDLLNSEELGTELEGAIVFYGQTFRGASDAIPDPIYGSLPGVFVHASHADDLIALGDRKFRPDRPWQLSTILYEIFLITLLTTVLFSLRVILKRVAKAKGCSPEQYGVSWKSRSLLMVFSATWLALEAAILRTTPEYWLTAFGIVAIDGLPWHKIKRVQLGLLRFQRSVRGAVD